jgi:hypothetical protein
MAKTSDIISQLSSDTLQRLKNAGISAAEFVQSIERAGKRGVDTAVNTVASDVQKVGHGMKFKIGQDMRDIDDTVSGALTSLTGYEPTPEGVLSKTKALAAKRQAEAQAAQNPVAPPKAVAAPAQALAPLATPEAAAPPEADPRGEPYWQGEGQVMGVQDADNNPVEYENLLGEALVQTGKPEPRYTQPAVNPYTGQPLRETPIFGGAGMISEAYRTPSDKTMRFANPYTQPNLTPIQQKQAAAEIEAIQKTKTQAQRKALDNLIRIDFEKARKIIQNPETPESVKVQLREQMNRTAEEAGTSDDIMDLIYTHDAAEDPKVALTRQRVAVEELWGQRLGNPDLGRLLGSFGDIDAKTGKPTWAAAQPFMAILEKEHAEKRADEREFTKSKEGALANLQKMATKAALHPEEPVFMQAYLAERDRFGDRYAPITGVKETYAEGEFDIAAELRAIQAAGKIARPTLNPDGPIEIDNDADQDALEAEAIRTGRVIQFTRDGILYNATPY